MPKKATQSVSLDLAEYTHSKLIARGYTRRDWADTYPGWVTYESRTGPKVGIAGNNATMNNWIEEVSDWKHNYPDLYAFWKDPTQTIRYDPAFHEVLIKGEDPMLIEAEVA
jgi:hypothetical protein